MPERVRLGVFSPSVLLGVAAAERHAGAGRARRSRRCPPPRRPSSSPRCSAATWTPRSPARTTCSRTATRRPTRSARRRRAHPRRGRPRARPVAVHAPRFTALRGGVLAVDVPTSGFAFVAYELLARLGLRAGQDYEVSPCGTTPRRATALITGECTMTVLNAGNDLRAEAAGCVRLSRADVARPVPRHRAGRHGDAHRADAARLHALAERHVTTARAICAGRLRTVAAGRRPRPGSASTRWPSSDTCGRSSTRGEGLVPRRAGRPAVARRRCAGCATGTARADPSSRRSSGRARDSSTSASSPAGPVSERLPHARLLQFTCLVSTLDRFVLPPMLLAVSRELDIALADVAGAAGAYFLAYGLMQPVWGLIGDRFGVVRTLRLAVLVGAVASAGTALAAGAASLVAVRIVAGIGFSAAVPDRAVLRRRDRRAGAPPPRHHPPDGRRRRWAPPPRTAGAGILAATVGWRSAYVLTGGAGLVLWLALRRLPELRSRGAAVEGTFAPLQAVLRSGRGPHPAAAGRRRGRRAAGHADVPARRRRPGRQRTGRGRPRSPPPSAWRCWCSPRWSARSSTVRRRRP